MMIRAFSANGGTLKAMHTGTVNGGLATKWNIEGGTHYWKYGIYGSRKTPNVQAQWRGVGFYTR